MTTPSTTTHAGTGMARILVWAAVFSGAAAVVLGLLLLIVPFGTLAAITVMFALQLLILGVVRIVQGFRSRQMDGAVRVGHVVLGAAVVVLAIICFVRPFSTIAILVILIGVAWIVDGVAEIINAWRAPGDRGGAVMGTLLAVISIIAGIVVLSQPIASAATLALFGGVILVVLGIVQLVSAFRLNRALRA